MHTQRAKFDHLLFAGHPEIFSGPFWPPGKKIQGSPGSLYNSQL